MGAIFFGSILMQDFFIAEGDGLPRGVVENAAAPVKHVLSMYSLDVRISHCLGTTHLHTQKTLFKTRHFYQIWVYFKEAYGCKFLN
jgi:hypothetical protein